jgi:hypothetical protein
MSRRLALALCVAVAASISGYDSYGAEKAAKKRGLVHEVSGQGYGAAGCGLGSILFSDQEGMVQVVAATSNGLWGNQTFAITSGTSNCEDSRGNSASLFIDGNKVALQNDVARGGGETLTAFSKVIGCSDSAELGKVLQKNYGRIYSGSSSAIEIRNNVMQAISTDQSLNKTCSVSS